MFLVLVIPGYRTDRMIFRAFPRDFLGIAFLTKTALGLTVNRSEIIKPSCSAFACTNLIFLFFSITASIQTASVQNQVLSGLSPYLIAMANSYRRIDSYKVVKKSSSKSLR